MNATDVCLQIPLHWLDVMMLSCLFLPAEFDLITCAGTPLGLLSGIYYRNPSGPKNKFAGVKTKVRPNRLQGSASLFRRGADPWSRFGLTLVLFPVNYFLDTVLWAGPGIDFT